MLGYVECGGCRGGGVYCGCRFPRFWLLGLGCVEIPAGVFALGFDLPRGWGILVGVI